MNRETPEAIDHYADALVALGRASGRMSALEKEVQDVLTSLESDVRLKRFLRDPVIKREGKREALESLFENTRRRHPASGHHRRADGRLPAVL